MSPRNGDLLSCILEGKLQILAYVSEILRWVNLRRLWCAELRIWIMWIWGSGSCKFEVLKYVNLRFWIMRIWDFELCGSEVLNHADPRFGHADLRSWNMPCGSKVLNHTDLRILIIRSWGSESCGSEFMTHTNLKFWIMRIWGSESCRFEVLNPADLMF